MKDAAQSVREFAAAVQQVVDSGAEQLAAKVSATYGSPVVTIEWSQFTNGDAGIYISLEDGHGLTGRGGGKLDALVDAEDRLL